MISDGYRQYSGSHYTLAVRHVLREVELWKRQKRIKESIQYILDWQDIGSDTRDEIEDLMGQASEWHQDSQPMDYAFRERKKIPGLQCVDLIAWLTLQLGLNNFHNKPMEGLAGECIKDFENYYPSGKVPPHQKWFQVPTVQRHNLEAWFRHEMDLGNSVKWFSDWYDRHPNRKVLLEVRKKRIQELLANRKTVAGSSGP